MKNIVLAAVALGLCLTPLSAGGGAEEAPSMDDVVSGHMVAEAMLTAHFIAAALKGGMSQDEINAVLAEVAEHSAISEFWISDGKGAIEFTNNPGTGFKFPTDPQAKAQAAPFAALLSGAKKVVVQDTQPRDIDARPFKYVGVSGVDGTRIVQVGVAGEE